MVESMETEEREARVQVVNEVTCNVWESVYGGETTEEKQVVDLAKIIVEHRQCKEWLKGVRYVPASQLHRYSTLLFECKVKSLNIVMEVRIHTGGRMVEELSKNGRSVRTESTVNSGELCYKLSTIYHLKGMTKTEENVAFKRIQGKLEKVSKTDSSRALHGRKVVFLRDTELNTQEVLRFIDESLDMLNDVFERLASGRVTALETVVRAFASTKGTSTISINKNKGVITYVNHVSTVRGQAIIHEIAYNHRLFETCRVLEFKVTSKVGSGDKQMVTDIGTAFSKGGLRATVQSHALQLKGAY